MNAVHRLRLLHHGYIDKLPNESFRNGMNSNELLTSNDGVDIVAIVQKFSARVH